MPFAEITRGITVPPPAPPIDRRAAAQRNQGRAAGPAAAACGAFQRAGVAPGRCGANPLPPGAGDPAGANPRRRPRLPLRRREPRCRRPRRAASAIAPPPRRGRCVPRQRLGQHWRRAAVGRHGRPPDGPPPVPGPGHGRRRELRLGRAAGVADRPLRHEKPRHEPSECLRDLPGAPQVPWLGMRTNRNLLLQFNRNVNNNANTLSELMPTLLQRNGDFSQTVDGFGNPVQLVDPAHGAPVRRATSSPPIASARRPRRCSRYYPLPQAGRHRPPTTTRSPRSQQKREPLVQRVDRQHRQQQHEPARRQRRLQPFVERLHVAVRIRRRLARLGIRHFAPTGRTASSRRTGSSSVRHTYNRNTNTSEPYFANSINVSGDAGITGNNQEPENWGPPSLSFAQRHCRALERPVLAQPDAVARVQRRPCRSTTGRHSSIVRRRRPLPDDRLRLAAERARRVHLQRVVHRARPSPTSCSAFRTRAPSPSAMPTRDSARGTTTRTSTTTSGRHPSLTINFGVRWDFEAPVDESAGGRLVNLDVADDFSAAAPVIAADGIGPITGRHYPSSLIESSPWGIQPRVGVAWRPIPTSSVILRAGYGIYRNTTSISRWRSRWRSSRRSRMRSTPSTRR